MNCSKSGEVTPRIIKTLSNHHPLSSPQASLQKPVAQKLSTTCSHTYLPSIKYTDRMSLAIVASSTYVLFL